MANSPDTSRPKPEPLKSSLALDRRVIRTKESRPAASEAIFLIGFDTEYEKSDSADPEDMKSNRVLSYQYSGKLVDEDGEEGDPVLLPVEKLAVAVVRLGGRLLHPEHLDGVVFKARRGLAGLIAVHLLEEGVGEFVRGSHGFDARCFFGRPDDIAPFGRIAQAHHPERAARRHVNSEPFPQWAERGHPVGRVIRHGARDLGSKCIT